MKLLLNIGNYGNKSKVDVCNLISNAINNLPDHPISYISGKEVKTLRISFWKAPIGARFKFPNSSQVWVIRENWGNGLISKWNGNVEGFQNACCWVDDEHTLETEIELI